MCHIPLTIDLEAPALELEENVKTRQGILGRLDIDKWRSSSKIEALIEELTTVKRQDATTKSIVFSQFVNFLDLIAFRLQKAGFTACIFILLSMNPADFVSSRSVDLRVPCLRKLVTPPLGTSVRSQYTCLDCQLMFTV